MQPTSRGRASADVSSADIVGDCFVFNVGGNKYRVVVHLDFEVQTMWIRFVLTHAEYDREHLER